MRRHLVPLIAAALTLAGPALAAEPADPQAATSTAAATADQIARFLRDSPAAELPREGVSGVTESAPAPRQVHGEVGVAVGSDGYRSFYVRSDMPVGKTGVLSLAVEDTRFSVHNAEYGAQGVGLRLGDGSADLPHDSCRWEADRRHQPTRCAVPGAYFAPSRPHF